MARVGSVVLVLVLVACGDGDASTSTGSTGSDGSSGTSTSTGTTTAEATSADSTTTTTSTTADTGSSVDETGGSSTSTTATGSGSGSSESGMACVPDEVAGTPAVDVVDFVLAVDTSGSMDEEVAAVEAELASAFWAPVATAMTNPHAVLVADAAMCLPMPPGSGMCGGMDGNPPDYMHVNNGVSSNDALQVLLSTYPQWSPMLRPGADRHILVVTDDDSDMQAADFEAQLQALDPTFADYRFHAIVATQDPEGCFGFSCPAMNACCGFDGFACLPLAAATGDVYMSLATSTGGVLSNLCDPDFAAHLDAIADLVIDDATGVCEWILPPEGMAEPTQVNVVLEDGVGGTVELLHVETDVDCDGVVVDAWYYDDPQAPTTIVFCPQTCALAEGLQEPAVASVVIELGCDIVRG